MFCFVFTRSHYQHWYDFHMHYAIFSHEIFQFNLYYSYPKTLYVLMFFCISAREKQKTLKLEVGQGKGCFEGPVFMCFLGSILPSFMTPAQSLWTPPRSQPWAFSGAPAHCPANLLPDHIFLQVCASPHTPFCQSPKVDNSLISLKPWNHLLFPDWTS